MKDNNEFEFQTARRENLFVVGGFIGQTGSGKTWSALEVATGIAKTTGKPIGFIDTEEGRALHYADSFDFQHARLSAPYTPERYLAAIVASHKAGHGVCVVDSFSHEHAGEGGQLDWHEEELTRMAGDDWKKREACNIAAWVKPKMAHKKMVQSLLSMPMHLILCFRAEPKLKMVKDSKTGKTKPEDAGIQPIAARGLDYELTFSFLLSNEEGKRGLPDTPLKLPAPIAHCFPKGKLIGQESGELVALWAAGSKQVEKKDPPAQRERVQTATPTPDDGPAEAPPARSTIQKDAPVHHGKVVQVTEKSGTSKRGLWTLYTIEMEGGERFGTFSESMKKIAEDFMSSGDEMAIVWETTAKGNKNIVEIVPF